LGGFGDEQNSKIQKRVVNKCAGFSRAGQPSLLTRILAIKISLANPVNEKDFHLGRIAKARSRAIPTGFMLARAKVIPTRCFAAVRALWMRCLHIGGLDPSGVTMAAQRGSWNQQQLAPATLQAKLSLLWP
jgi:hypothetical protein